MDNIRKNNIGLFCARSANDVMVEASQMAAPAQLYKPFINENEITMIMADTNVGKSIFSLQIANEIAKSHAVLYIDLEQSIKQFERRYSEEFENHYSFSEMLYWVNFAEGYICPSGESYEDFFIRSLLELVKQYSSKVVVVDNMTKLLLTDTDTAQNAKPLMDSLCKLKLDNNLTLILVEHTRKMNKPRAISLDDLQGSKMKVNFADSVVAIGRSNLDLNLRYVKHLKCRSSEIENDADNVMLFEIRKDGNFLGFHYLNNDTEYNHVKGDADKIRERRDQQIQVLKEGGVSNRQIAKELGVSEGCVRKSLLRHRAGPT